MPLLLFIDADLWAPHERARRSGHERTVHWAWMAFLVFPCAVAGFPLWNWVLKYLPASTAAFAIFLGPPLTFLFSFLMQGLVPQPLELVGGSIVLGGVGIVIARRWRTP